jgi:hypothetical protein
MAGHVGGMRRAIYSYFQKRHQIGVLIDVTCLHFKSTLVIVLTESWVNLGLKLHFRDRQSFWNLGIHI